MTIVEFLEKHYDSIWWLILWGMILFAGAISDLGGSSK